MRGCVASMPQEGCALAVGSIVHLFAAGAKGAWVWRLGLLGSRLRGSDDENRGSGIEHRGSGIEHRRSGIEHRRSDVEACGCGIEDCWHDLPGFGHYPALWLLLYLCR